MLRPYLLAACGSLLLASACADDEEASVVGDEGVVTVAAGDLYTPAAGFSVGARGFRSFGVASRSERVVTARSDRPCASRICAASSRTWA